jgi:hypothetical protein
LYSHPRSGVAQHVTPHLSRSDSQVTLGAPYMQREGSASSPINDIYRTLCNASRSVIKGHQKRWTWCSCILGCRARPRALPEAMSGYTEGPKRVHIPMPLSLTPPNGMTACEIKPVLLPTMPTSNCTNRVNHAACGGGNTRTASATRHTLPISRE